MCIGHVAGGSLKTPAEADKESLQAKWLPADVGKLRQEVKLRWVELVMNNIV